MGSYGVMKRAKLTPWKERDFEKWFTAHPALPDGEELAVIGQESALRRVADIVALDANAGLVIMEIKNETALRATVGQALEYLSQYEEATVESLSDDLRRLDERSIEEVFSQVFGKALTSIHASRRVIIHTAGNYRVELDYAVPAHREGTLLDLAFGDQRLRVHIHGTGGWEEFVRLHAGEITLEPAEQLAVRVLPVTVPLGTVMNLRGVHLTPL